MVVNTIIKTQAAIDLDNLSGPVTLLSSSNFANGSYRIHSGGIYRLAENIVFNPSDSAPTSPVCRIGGIINIPLGKWFCAISIETTDPVVIDLNGKSISVAQAYLDTIIYKVFAIIECNNSPFMPNANEAVRYNDADPYISAQHVKIMNGTIGTSPHLGIHGSKLKTLIIRDVTVEDFEIAGISLNSVTEYCEINRVNIVGTSRPINIHWPAAPLDFLSKLLGFFSVAPLPPPPATPNPEINAVAIALKAIVDAEILTLDDTITTPYSPSSMYGILIQNAPSSIFSLYPTKADIAFTNFLFGASNSANIYINNVNISNLQISTKEEVLIGYGTSPSHNAFPRIPGASIGPGLLGMLVQSLPWSELGTQSAPGSNVCVPKILLKATVFCMSIIEPAAPFPVLPTDFAANILSPSPTVNPLQIQPVFQRGVSGDFIRGSNGIKISGCDNVVICNVKVYTIRNFGADGKLLSTVQFHDLYPSLTQTKYRGKDIWGVFGIASSKISMENIEVYDLLSDRGEIFGFHLLNETDPTIIKNSYAKDLYITYPIGTNPVVNPDNEIYTLLFEHAFGSKTFETTQRNIICFSNPSSTQYTFVQATPATNTVILKNIENAISILEALYGSLLLNNSKFIDIVSLKTALFYLRKVLPPSPNRKISDLFLKQDAINKSPLTETEIKNLLAEALEYIKNAINLQLVTPTTDKAFTLTNLKCACVAISDLNMIVNKKLQIKNATVDCQLVSNLNPSG